MYAIPITAPNDMFFTPIVPQLHPSGVEVIVNSANLAILHGPSIEKKLPQKFRKSLFNLKIVHIPHTDLAISVALTNLCRAISRPSTLHRIVRISNYTIGPDFVVILNLMKRHFPPKLQNGLISSLQTQQYLSYEKLLNFIGLLHHLEDTSFHPGFHLPITIWRTNCRIRSANEFVFHCGSCSKKKKTSQLILTKDDIFHLRHGTTGTDLADMLNLSKNAVFLKGYRHTRPEMMKDVCPQGLLYFDVDLESKNVSNFHAFQNRYGAASIKFHLENAPLLIQKKPWRYFKVGTKKYSKGYKQQIHATKSTEFWLLEESRSELHSLSEINLDAGFQWELNYCALNCQNGFWTHPEIVIDGNLEVKLSEVKIRFEPNHKCIQLPDGRRFNCIECDIRESFGLCYALVGGNWVVVMLDVSSSEDLSIQMFALSMPHNNRNKLEKMYQKKAGLFEKGQFDKILYHWKNTAEMWVERWATSKNLDLMYTIYQLSRGNLRY
ncbi:uncharacterized protein LOC110855970 [Folsomia candida]|uniref:Uncharacterized protein n=1 Tax=Folsomia candida TaxID=158441 RepID=A0A226EZ46_FOLCA|nr:uncharacterized protein LOC110855970 [Folsomia candida]XP_021960112.1 uncharacterized protein LOC110855970 [Folsomia candida]OXA62862.1 hypothetical protein Fcan01_00805 [Folsomia candida]